MSIYRQPWESRDYRGALDSGLVYLLLTKHGTNTTTILDQFPGGETITRVGTQLGMAVTKTDFPTEDARSLNHTDSTFQLVLSHPPYWGAIKYSNHPTDLCSCPTYSSYLTELFKSFDEAERVLEPEGTLIIIAGDVRRNKILYPVHSDIIQYFRRHQNMTLVDWLIWELTATSTPFLSTQYMLMGTFVLTYKKIGNKVDEWFE